MWRQHAKMNDRDDDLDEFEALPSTDSMKEKIRYEVNESIQEVIRDELNDNLDLNEFLKNAETLVTHFVSHTPQSKYSPKSATNNLVNAPL